MDENRLQYSPPMVGSCAVPSLMWIFIHCVLWCIITTYATTNSAAETVNVPTKQVGWTRSAMLQERNACRTDMPVAK